MATPVIAIQDLILTVGISEDFSEAQVRMKANGVHIVNFIARKGMGSSEHHLLISGKPGDIVQKLLDANIAKVCVQ